MDIHAIIREARAEGVGIYAPPSELFCTICTKQVTVVGFILSAPDELSCGHTFIPHELARCTNCGWPHAHDHEDSALMGAHQYCGDGMHGCRPKVEA